MSGLESEWVSEGGWMDGSVSEWMSEDGWVSE